MIRVLGGIFGITVAIIGLVIFYAAFIEPYWIEVKEQPVYISHLPEDFEGFRIVQLSDLHGKRFAGKEMGRRLTKLNPDLVVITGDVFNRETPARYLAEVLDGLKAKYGTYFVFGNSEFYLDKHKIKETLAGYNIQTLINQGVPITIKWSRIYLAGIDDPYSMNYDIPQALRGAGSEPKILLAHTPEIIYLAEKYGIDLTLVGHTHGGQIKIPFYPRISNVSKGYEKYLAGLFEVGRAQIYVNRGLGESVIPMRFMTRPEITLLTLYGK